MFIAFTIHVQWVASELRRNETAVSVDRIGKKYVPWNKTLYKTEKNCSDFHSTLSPGLYYFWPEDNSGFDFCCALDGASYEKFTYGNSGPPLQYMRYYDLGLINECLPYWKCLDLFETMKYHALYKIYCEFTDLRRLYRTRFLNDTVIKRGFLQSAIPFILLAEIAVIAFVAVYWFLRRRRCSPLDRSHNIMLEATRKWRKAVRPVLFMDWSHLCLLAVVGNGLIEAVGRQYGAGAQSKAFYNYSRLYIILSILLWCSSVLHQIAMYIAEIENSCDEAVLPQSTDEAPGLAEVARSGSAQVEATINLAPDWRWQPIGAQAGILFCLWGFLTYSSDDATTGAMFGIIVSAACPWSGLYASKIILHTFPWILARVYQKIIKAGNAGASHRSYRSLWAKAFHLRSGVGYFQRVNSNPPSTYIQPDVLVL